MEVKSALELKTNVNDPAYGNLWEGFPPSPYPPHFIRLSFTSAIARALLVQEIYISNYTS